MRLPRWKEGPEEQAGPYHCVSRVVDKNHVFEEREREKLRTLLREYSLFCGVRRDEPNRSVIRTRSRSLQFSPILFI